MYKAKFCLAIVIFINVCVLWGEYQIYFKKKVA